MDIQFDKFSGQDSTDRAYRFEFSVVMAVYNCAPFLNEAVESLTAQTIGFDKIQLIMVDDGSSDESGAICDRYAELYSENVVVIHKENGGVLSARNEGLKYAVGRYINFMDSDDKFSENAFETVYAFFAGNEDKTDIVTIPICFFDAQTGEHWQNNKFKKGSRIINLVDEYNAALMFVNASFFKQSVKDRILFDDRLVCGEDIKVLITILAEKMRYGVVIGCTYWYRRRSVGEASIIQSVKKKYGWYFDYFTYLIDWGVNLYCKRFGYIPAFLQYLFVGDIAWRFKEIYDMSAVLSADEAERYKRRLFDTLKYFDDKYIMEQRHIWIEHKCYMLQKKYDRKPDMSSSGSDITVHYGNTVVSKLSEQYSKIDFISLAHDELTIEGFVKLFGVDETDEVKVYLAVDDRFVECTEEKRPELNEYRFDELIFRGIGFRKTIHIDDQTEEYEIKIAVKCNETYVVKRNIRVGNFCAVSNKYRNQYYYTNGHVIQLDNYVIRIKKCGIKGRIQREASFLKELWQKDHTGSRKAVAARIVTALLAVLKRRPLWIISDRESKAGDNGEALFHYMQGHKEINSVFAILGDCRDFNRLRKCGKVTAMNSYKYKLYMLLSDYIISSQADDELTNPFREYIDCYRDIMSQKRFVFLQHGITKDDISNWLNKFNKNIFGFITAATPEYQSIIEGKYHYTKKQVWLTGFPRFDHLEDHAQKQIVIMPTWRSYLFTSRNSDTGEWNLKPGFKESRFYVFYKQLMEDQRLRSAALKYGYSIAFFPHPTMQAVKNFFEVFEVPGHIRILDRSTEYKTVYKESCFVVTDYSSAVFDFAYLKKPLIYAQFDKEEFFSGAHMFTKGYFDYERDGFGEVEYDLDSTVDMIIEYMRNGCIMKDKYRDRVDSFFAYRDKCNCERVYNKLIAAAEYDK